MKMYEVLELQNLYNSIAEIKLPLKTSYKFAKLMKRVGDEVSFYQNEFGKIIEEYGAKDENGHYKMSSDGMSIAIIEGKEMECNSKIAELRSLEVEIDNISFTIEELDGLNISISELECLVPLIVD